MLHELILFYQGYVFQVPVFPLFSLTSDSWKPVLLIKTELKNLVTQPFPSLILFSRGSTFSLAFLLSLMCLWKLRLPFTPLCRSLLKMLNRTGPSIDSWGTVLVTGLQVNSCHWSPQKLIIFLCKFLYAYNAYVSLNTWKVLGELYFPLGNLLL